MYKAWIKTAGSSTYATNGLEFDHIGEAADYADDLMGRWTAVEGWAVLPVSAGATGWKSPEEIAKQGVDWSNLRW